MQDVLNLEDENKIVVCDRCSGDDRHSLDCEKCQGAGIGISSKYGFLVWNTLIDDFTISFKKISRKVNLGFNLIVVLLLLTNLLIFFWLVVENDLLLKNPFYTIITVFIALIGAGYLFIYKIGFVILPNYWQCLMNL